MRRLEVSCAVRLIYLYVVRRQRVNGCFKSIKNAFGANFFSYFLLFFICCNKRHYSADIRWYSIKAGPITIWYICVPEIIWGSTGSNCGTSTMSKQGHTTRYLHDMYVIHGLHNGRLGPCLFAVLWPHTHTHTHTLCSLVRSTVHASSGAQVKCTQTLERGVILWSACINVEFNF